MPKRPGRPTREQAQDAAAGIVQAACLHFAKYGIRGTSNRQIADAAGVTPALVHYYFPRKQSLYRAVLQQCFAPLLEQLTQTADLQDWVQRFHAHIQARPWCPHLLLREILPQDGGLRSLFLADWAPLVFGSVKTMVKQEFRSQQVSRRLDTDRHVVLLIGMLVYPFLGMEVAQTVTGRHFDARMMQRFRDDALALFCHGIAGR